MQHIIKITLATSSTWSLALMKLAEMEYGGTTSYFIKLLVEKKYALPYRVVDAMVAHFMRFCEDSRDMPVIWHQSLLVFMQRLVSSALLHAFRPSLLTHFQGKKKVCHKDLTCCVNFLL